MGDYLLKKKYDVIFTSSIAIYPFPRLENAAKCLGKELNLKCLAVGWDRGKNFSSFEKKDHLEIFRIKYSGEYGGGLKNLFGLLRFNLRLFALHLKLRPRIIHAYDFDTVIPALLARIFIKCEVIYDIADWYAESRRVGKLKKLVEKLERAACKRADAVIIAHEERVKQIGFVPPKLTVIYNSPCGMAPSKAENEKESFTKNGYFAYVGVLHKDRGIDKIIDAAVKIGVQVVLAGFGPLESYCKQMSQKYKNIEFLGQIPYEKTLSIEKNALGILALYDPDLPNNKLAAPNKLFESMMLGVPIITSRETLVGKIVEQEKIGIAVNYNSQEELVNAMELLIRDEKLRNDFGKQAQELYRLKYSCAIQCEKLKQLYRELLLNV